MLMSRGYHCGVAFPSTCYNLPCPKPSPPLLPKEAYWEIAPYTTFPSADADYTVNRLLYYARLTELNFRLCYQRVMMAGYCASIWQRTGTAIEIPCAIICGFQPASSCKSLSLSLHTHLCCVAPSHRQYCSGSAAWLRLQKCWHFLRTTCPELVAVVFPCGASVFPTEPGSPVEQKPQGQPRSLCPPWETAHVFLSLLQERRQSLGWCSWASW